MENQKKGGLCSRLDAVKRWGNSLIEHFNNSYLDQKKRAKLNLIDKEAQVIPISQYKKIFSHFGIWDVSAFICVQI